MQENIQNRTIFCKDNLKVLQGINANTIDLIYLDPPFNKKKVFTAPIGSSAEGAEFSDWFRLEDVKQEWVESIKEDNEKLHNFLSGIKNIDGKDSYNFCYLAYMSIRLIECHRILKNTGSLYLHCDQTMSHYIKIMMDCVFGESNFLNEIIWCYKSGGVSKKYYSRKHDNIFFYSKTNRYTFHKQKEKSYSKTFTKATDGEDPFWGQEFFKDEHGVYCYVHARDYWHMPIIHSSAKERTGYPTQKPLALLERIIKGSSNEKDVVLDPFCGCATTCVAAERLRRKWIGIDISVKAYELVKQRMAKEVADAKDMLKYQNEVYFSTDAPTRTDDGVDHQQQKYVYVVSNVAYPNEYKVGIAKDIDQRITSYQTSDPNRGYKEEYSVLTPHYRVLEKHIHTTFEHKHEWVRADLKAIKDAIQTFLKNL